jgi:hypothetical protein
MYGHNGLLGGEPYLYKNKSFEVTTAVNVLSVVSWLWHLVEF